jgi:hypothetical protein
VGYAFINFIDPLSIIPFAKARVGTKWFSPRSLPFLSPFVFHCFSSFSFRTDMYPKCFAGVDSRNRFHSDKICDISYANIQGKECLIEKFRNSCVMDEDPSYRPKIFHSTGALMGQEQESVPQTSLIDLPFLLSFFHIFLYMILATLSQIFGLSDGRFPEPNNARRKLRSIACARQIGPFPPPSPFIIQHSHLRSRLYPLCLEFTSRALPSRRLEKTRLLISPTSLTRHFTWTYLCLHLFFLWISLLWIHGLSYLIAICLLCICI